MKRWGTPGKGALRVVFPANAISKVDNSARTSTQATNPKAQMQNNMNYGSGMMGGYGWWPIIGVVLIVLLVYAIIRISKKQ